MSPLTNEAAIQLEGMCVRRIEIGLLLMDDGDAQHPGFCVVGFKWRSARKAFL